MMPVEWQRAFLNSGQVITNNNYTLLALQCFMTLQEEQNQADVARRCHQHQRVGRQHTGCQGRSPGRRYPAGDGGAASPRRRAPVAPPAVPPTQQAPAALKPSIVGSLVHLTKVHDLTKVELITLINAPLGQLKVVVVVVVMVEVSSAGRSCTKSARWESSQRSAF